jgi:hypothetical protein
MQNFHFYLGDCCGGSAGPFFAVIDPSTDEVVGRYAVGQCRRNHGMALDSEHRGTFLSCEENDLMTVLNLETNQPIAFLPMASDADVIKFDAGLKRIYVACSSRSDFGV